MTTRRSFLAGILAAGVAPAAVGSGILMPVRKIIVPRQAVIAGFGLASVDYEGRPLQFSVIVNSVTFDQVKRLYGGALPPYIVRVERV